MQPQSTVRRSRWCVNLLHNDLVWTMTLKPPHHQKGSICAIDVDQRWHKIRTRIQFHPTKDTFITYCAIRPYILQQLRCRCFQPYTIERLQCKTWWSKSIFTIYSINPEPRQNEKNLKKDFFLYIKNSLLWLARDQWRPPCSNAAKWW